MCTTAAAQNSLVPFVTCQVRLENTPPTDCIQIIEIRQCFLKLRFKKSGWFLNKTLYIQYRWLDLICLGIRIIQQSVRVDECRMFIDVVLVFYTNLFSRLWRWCQIARSFVQLLCDCQVKWLAVKAASEMTYIVSSGRQTLLQPIPILYW